MKKNSSETNGNKKGWKFYIPMVLIIAAVVTLSAFWYSRYTSYISTDDAYIDSDRITVSSQMMGRILASFADEGDTVKEGELLVVLDSSDIIANRKQAESHRDQAIAGQQQAVAQLAFQKESVKEVEIAYQKSLDDYDRASKQYEGHVITQEQFDHATRTREAAKARLDAAQSQLKVADASIRAAVTAIESAGAQIDILNNQLQKTKIYAPATGIIARRWMLPGEVTQPGQAILTISETTGLHVMVYLEETKLRNVRLGQDVTFNVDAYPAENFSGKVYYIGANTASQFSLIPASNASGNFTKVTQRVPVKISIDKINTSPGDRPVELVSGMSAEIKIIK